MELILAVFFSFSFTQIAIANLILIIVFFRVIYKQVPFSGTLSLELAVSLFCFTIWTYFGEIRARELILVKLLVVPVIFALCPNNIKNLRKFKILINNIKYKYLLLFFHNNISPFLDCQKFIQ